MREHLTRNAVSEEASISTLDSGDAISQGSEDAGTNPCRQTAERIRVLDAIKATGIVMVVAVHALTRVDLDPPSHELISFLVGTVAVPLFFLTDGFLFSWKCTEAPGFDYKSFIRKSGKRLLVPWAAFTVLYTIFRFVIERYGLTRETILFGNDLLGMAQVIYLSGVSPHMYFLLSLFLVRLGTFGLYRILKLPTWLWFALSLVYIGIYHASHPKDWFLPGADPILLACWGAQFYLLGIGLQKGLAFVRLYARPLLFLCVGMTIGFQLFMPSNMVFISQLFYLIGTYVTLLLITERTSWSFSMGKDTMGIYLLHAPIVVWAVAAVVTRIVAPGQVLAFAILTFLTILVSWSGSRLLGKCAVGRLLLGQQEPIHARS